MDWAVSLTEGPLREVGKRVQEALPAARDAAGGEASELLDNDAAVAVKAAELLARQLGAKVDSNVQVAVSGHANPKRGPDAHGRGEQLAVSVVVTEPGA